MWGSLVVSTCAAAALAVAGTGCVSGDCGEGTVRYGSTCVAVDPFDKTPPQIALDPPLHTREVGIVRLTADEPATIYYTTDGSEPTTDSAHETEQVLIAGVPDDAQLRYFAIDLAGNRSDEQSRVWIIDRSGPPAPVGFKLTLAGPDRQVRWTAPPDPRPGGVLVARVDGNLLTAPASGKAYEVGDTLAPGITVVHVAPAGTAASPSFAESVASRPGLVRYVAWSFDNLHNYGPPAGDYALVPVPPQTGRVTVNAGTGAVAATIAPSHVALSGTATLAGSTLTLKLTVRNDTGRVLFAPKLVLTGTPAGGTWSNADGMLAGSPYRAYGAAIPTGGVATRSWTFTGASSTTTLALDLDLRDGQILTTATRDEATGGRIFDLATGKPVQTLATAPTGPRGKSTTTRGGITPDARMIVGSRNSGTVSSFDLSTGKKLLTTTLRAQKAHVPLVILDRSGSAAYALLADGHPYSSNTNGDGTGTPTTLVRLDAATLTESGRLSLDASRNRDADLSPDGRTLLITTGVAGRGVIVVDLETFTIKGRILTGSRPQCAVFSPDGASIAVVGEQIAVYQASDLSRGATFPTPGVNGKVMRAVFSGPSTLWIGRRNELAKIDLGTGATNLFTTIQGRLLDVVDGKVLAGSFAVQQLSPAGVVESTITVPNLRGHWIGRSPF
jgi:hypothetical protein